MVFSMVARLEVVGRFALHASVVSNGDVCAGMMIFSSCAMTCAMTAYDDEMKSAVVVAFASFASFASFALWLYAKKKIG